MPERRTIDTNLPPGMLADYMLKTESILVTRDNEEMFFYRNGVYLRDAENIIKDWSKELLGAGFTTHLWRELRHHLKSSGHIDRESLDADVNLINVSNGLVDYRTGELKPHSPDCLTTVQLPFPYDPDADCPNVRRFLDEVLRPKDIPTIIEFFGYCLYRKYPIQKWLLLVGSGANGKSKLIGLLSAFVGKANCVGNSLQVITGREFSLADLYRKLVDVCADLPTKGVSETALLKQLTGEDLIRGEYKYGKTFFFTNFAKLIFSANEPPQILSDDTMAFWRRLIMIEFQNTFVEGKNADPNILDRLTTQKELSGLLNLALGGLRTLLANGRFSYDTSWQDTAKAYKMRSNPMMIFVEEYCDFSPSHWDSSDNIYNNYVRFCEWATALPRPKVAFLRQLNEKFSGKIAPLRRNDVAGYRGLAVCQPALSNLGLNTKPPEPTGEHKEEQHG